MLVQVFSSIWDQKGVPEQEAGYPEDTELVRGMNNCFN
jgi:hypothetical protein